MYRYILRTLTSRTGRYGISTRSISIVNSNRWLSQFIQCNSFINFPSRNSSRFLKSKYSDSSTDKTPNDTVAYEAEYYYKQDKELLEILKQKLQEEIKCMQDEVRTMRSKMDEYNRNINENLRFLKSLEKDLSASDKK